MYCNAGAFFCYIRYMRILLILFILSCTSLLHGQTVMDGVYVKEHIPTQIRNVFPVPIKYEFEDDRNFGLLRAQISKQNNQAAQLPFIEGTTLVNYHIVELTNILKDSGIKNCEKLFYRYYNSKDYLVEGYFPPFLKFYLNEVKQNQYEKQLLDNRKEGPVIFIEGKVKPVLKEFYTPFYFKNIEVTNQEYRAFCNWVRDSIARKILAMDPPEGTDLYDWLLPKEDDEHNLKEESEWNLNWKTEIKWYDDHFKPILSSMYLPENQRYYKRKEFDTRKFIFEYIDETNERHKVHVFPDTLVWSDQIPEMFNLPGPMMYFWHPAYDNYPVAGLTAEQIKAYLFWRTKMHNQSNKRRGIKQKVKYSLPNEMQWELASEIQLHRSAPSFATYLKTAADYSYLTALQLKPDVDTGMTDSLHLKAIISSLYIKSINGSSTQIMNFTKTSPDWIDLPRGKEMNKYKKDIQGMHSNFSEMLTAVDSTYFKLFEIRWKILRSYNSKSLNRLVEMEKELFKNNCKGNILVHGSNWMNENLNEHEAMNTKCFIDGKKPYSTLGFRYVITIVEE